MDKHKPASGGSRFNENARPAPTASRPSARQADAARRPSGFGTAGQSHKSKPLSSPEAEAKKTGKNKAEKAAKKKRVPKEREPGKNRPVLRVLLALLAAAVIVSILMVLIFGGEDTTYHQMPTIERESTADFEPEATPIPGTEGP